MWFYNLIILVWALVSLRKKHWGTIRARFVGPSIPKKTTYRIWVHAVSLGEAKSVLPLLERFPEAEILFSTTTKTGFSIAKQFPHAFYLPLDLSWIMRRLSKAIDPDLFILVETDIWLNLLRAIKAPKVLVNARHKAPSHDHGSRMLVTVIHYPYLVYEGDLMREAFNEIGYCRKTLWVARGEHNGVMRWQMV